jgi:nucleoside 2-deoxyribosyltransferase
MNIYFSCSITGGRTDQQNYQAIVDHLLRSGHTVPTAHLSKLDVFSLEAVVKPTEVFLRDMKWIEECDALIAEVSTPSHGVGYEIAQALFQKKPVFCCYQIGRRVSKIITGNTSSTIVARNYQNIDDLLKMIDEFLQHPPKN